MDKDEMRAALSQEHDDAGQTLQDIKEVNRAELFKDIIRPDLQRHKLEKDIEFFTKELKTSFLTPFEMGVSEEVLDIARNAVSMGALGAARNLVAYVNIKLSIAPSKGGALLRLMNTEYSVKRMNFDTGRRRFFQRKGREEE